jgi:hypothetical protein
MRKCFLLIVCFVLFVGCSPTLTVNKDGSIIAKDYAIVKKGDSVSYLPRPFFTMSFFDNIVKLAEGLVEEAVKVPAVVLPVVAGIPSTSPVTQPSVPTPVTPQPPIVVPVVPAPTPVPTGLVLFDLATVPAELNAAGFPGRGGVVLYALGQVARGWPIPLQSEELIAINGYYGQIRAWYEAKVNAIKDKLRANPGLSVIAITNDQVDRFGCRLGPPTMELLSEFGNRVQPGNIVQESEYK